MPSENLKHKFPETIINLKDACKINKNIMNILNNLANKCMTGFRKNVMLVALYSVKRSQRSLCRAKATKVLWISCCGLPQRGEAFVSANRFAHSVCLI